MKVYINLCGADEGGQMVNVAFLDKKKALEWICLNFSSNMLNAERDFRQFFQEVEVIT